MHIRDILPELYMCGRGACYGVRQSTDKVRKLINRGTRLESRTVEGDSPVCEVNQSLNEYPSNPEHEKFWMNL